MKKRWDVVAIIGKTEEGKPIWGKIGALIHKDNNKLSLKLDLIPIGWDGWAEIVSIKEPKKQDSNGNDN